MGGAPGRVPPGEPTPPGLYSAPAGEASGSFREIAAETGVSVNSVNTLPVLLGKLLQRRVDLPEQNLPRVRRLGSGIG